MGRFYAYDLYTREQLSSLVKDPIGNNKLLRELSTILYSTNGAFTNTVDYMTAMPTLDKVIVPHGKNIEKRRRNKELMESTLRTIKDKEIIRDALWRGMIEGIAFYYFETTGRPNQFQKMLSDYDVNSIAEINEFGINASIISLPADYTEIVGMELLRKSNMKTHDEFINGVKSSNIHYKTFEIIEQYSGVDNGILCKCKLCGNEWSPRAGHLLTSNCACPICRVSKGEMTIKQYLEYNKIDFECQKTFDGLCGIRGGALRYDFYIQSKNLLIEYQGEFHDGTVVYQSEQEYKVRQEHDKRKKQYAKDNNIELLEIWYWDYKNIDEILRRKLKI